MLHLLYFSRENMVVALILDNIVESDLQFGAKAFAHPGILQFPPLEIIKRLEMFSLLKTYFKRKGPEITLWFLKIC